MSDNQRIAPKNLAGAICDADALRFAKTAWQPSSSVDEIFSMRSQLESEWRRTWVVYARKAWTVKHHVRQAKERVRVLRINTPPRADALTASMRKKRILSLWQSKLDKTELQLFVSSRQACCGAHEKHAWQFRRNGVRVGGGEEGCSESVCKQLGAPTKSSRTVRQVSRLRLHLQLRLQRRDCSSNQFLQRESGHMPVQLHHLEEVEQFVSRFAAEVSAFPVTLHYRKSPCRSLTDPDGELPSLHARSGPCPSQGSGQHSGPKRVRGALHDSTKFCFGKAQRHCLLRRPPVLDEVHVPHCCVPEVLRRSGQTSRAICVHIQVRVRLWRWYQKLGQPGGVRWCLSLLAPTSFGTIPCLRMPDRVGLTRDAPHGPLSIWSCVLQLRSAESCRPLEAHLSSAGSWLQVCQAHACSAPVS